MPFVPLSTDGTQRATTEPLRAPRVQVALEPHEAGVTVLAVEPNGLRAIGQLDLTAADGYRRVLAPLAADGLYGICVAESSGTGTVLRLAPAASCLPAGDWPWHPGAGSDGGSAELAAWLAAPTLATPAAPTGRAPVVAVAAPAPRRPAHRRSLRTTRAAARRRATTPWILAGLIGLLMVGAIAQALTGGRSASTSLAAAESGPVPVPGFAAAPLAPEPPAVLAAPSAVAEAADPPPARPPAQPPAPAKPAPQPPAPAAPAADEHEDADHHEDAHPAPSGGGDKGDKKDSSDAKKDDKEDDAKPSGSSSSGSSSGGSAQGSGGGGKATGTPPKDRRPHSLADLWRQLADQRSGGGRPRLPVPYFGR
jgi:uncharacterized membrane protein YgcG